MTEAPPTVAQPLAETGKVFVTSVTVIELLRQCESLEAVGEQLAKTSQTILNMAKMGFTLVGVNRNDGSVEVQTTNAWGQLFGLSSTM